MTDEILTAIATARAFLQAAEAQRVVLILDRPEQLPAMVEVDQFLDAEITDGDDVSIVSSSTPIDHPPKPFSPIRPAPSSAISIDLTTGEIAAPIGTVEHLAQSVLALATSFGGRSVVSAEFGTADPELPITLAARAGERVVLGAGEETFEL